ncbi:MULTISPECIES: molecular chaperone [Enterobacter cloacae complex]|uniref:fimbrial biogenesis chaperone n=1 Tax=Enterobacter cloacae complex TaxID=354276 RepID=UPI00100E0517|nr:MULTISPECIES: molecular chaperone [Enterobacter cloacae complex]MBT1944373.1 molecular chaperone [Enterobacter hormaechei subsp. xiangfangensis]MCW4909000.1 molecular chaperone [Enterobacter hormaechei subsp. xiangfangensis]MEB7341879.1 molecular chaperone [Enterobacter hormaechei]RYA55405.1 fimbrial assembly protein [Enterobacter cloacae complex sp. GF14B]HAV1850641.1 molecular chaperone [Enterobacter hormaechei subsp. xiangfangensis]
MKKLTAALFFYSLGMSLSAHAGVVMGGTRVVYLEGQREVAFSITNMEKETPYLIQSWIENIDSKNKTAPPFIVTPTLFRLDAEQKNSLRINYLGTPLPTDRESVFWLNIKNIAPSKKANSNKLQINVKSKFKLFFRPAGLKGNAELAYKKLKFTCRNNTLSAHNPSPWFVSFYKVSVGNTDLEMPGMIDPFSDRQWHIPCSGTIRWQAINDYGGLTRVATQS